MDGDPERTRAATHPRTAEPADALVPGPRAPAPEEAGPSRPRFADSLIGQVWDRLQALDFVNRGTLLASVLLLCFVPFMIVVRAVSGRGAATSLTTRFGLDPQAADAVSHVFISPTATTGAISGLSWVVVVVGGISAAGAIQQLYESGFDLERRGLRDTPRHVAWLLWVVVASGLAGWAGPGLRGLAGPVVLAVVGLVWFTGFWWLGMWVLLGGRMTWSQLFPSALATAIFWLGTTVAFRLTMSATITENYRQYGAIGVIFAVMTVLIAIGVVVLLGAVVGAVWQERRAGRTG